MVSTSVSKVLFSQGSIEYEASTEKIVGRESVLVKRISTPYNTGKLYRKYDQFLMMFYYSFIYRSQYIYYTCIFKITSTMLVILLPVYKISEEKSVPTYFIYTIVVIGAQVIAANSIYIALRCRKIEACFMKKLAILLYIFILQALLFFICLLMCALMSMLELCLVRVDVFAVGLLSVINEMVYGVVLIMFSIIMGICYAIEFCKKVWKGEIKCRKLKEGMEQVDVTIFQMGLQEKVICIICQCCIMSSEKICEIDCKCKSCYHLDCIVQWYKEKHFCPLCFKFADLK